MQADYWSYRRRLLASFGYLLATSTQVRLLLKNPMLHNRKYFVLCKTLSAGAALGSQNGAELRRVYAFGTVVHKTR